MPLFSPSHPTRQDALLPAIFVLSRSNSSTYPARVRLGSSLLAALLDGILISLGSYLYYEMV